jgi:hypothetical protein
MVFGRILRAWMPAIHPGMTKICIFMSVGDRKIMVHFVVTQYLPIHSSTKLQRFRDNYFGASCASRLYMLRTSGRQSV